MRRKDAIPSILLFVLLLSLGLLAGCATVKPITKEDLSSLGSLKVVRHETPTLQIWGGGGNAAWWLGVHFGGLIGSGWRKATEKNVEKDSKEVWKRIEIPDYGELLMNGFVRRVSQEVPGWPEMVMDGRPVDEKFQYTGGSLLEFRVLPGKWKFQIGDMGLEANVQVTLKDAAGKEIWRSKEYTGYMGAAWSINNRKASVDDLMADNAKLLKEEMAYGADYTVSELIKQLKGEK